MPHATETMTNGEKTSSQFISHLTSYPVVNDSIESFKSNQYGRKSIEIVDGVYTRFGKPVQPYLETPYGYAKPYVQKADELADSGLDRVDSHFPIVKKDTNTVVDTAKSYIWWPYNYVTDTWNGKLSLHFCISPPHRRSGLTDVSTLASQTNTARQLNTTRAARA